ncbi:uncharacterized protein UTRI_05005 [Ustilago trichophora]|uniref:Myb-like domain-containing protein n=1 Tax=Ustilago trichophora TaxID=86804 RepID=A0A5C3EB59_9BASI|nr:uncharacterized protein UTRI_05005 [Ustilago trichophora]
MKLFARHASTGVPDFIYTPRLRLAPERPRTTMNTNPQLDPALACLPESLRPSFLALESTEMDEMPDIVDMSQVFCQQMMQRPSLPPESPSNSQELRYVPQASQSQSVAPSRSSQSVMSVPLSMSSSRGNKNHWTPDDVEVLILAVHNHNPYKHRTNTDKGAAWKRVLEEVNVVFVGLRQRKRSMQGIKEKWKQIYSNRKHEDRELASSSSIVELRSEMERLVDNVIQSDVASSYGRIARETAEQHRRRLLELTGRIHGTAASQSMSSRTQRALSSQEMPSSSQPVDEESDTSIDSVAGTPARKRARNATHEALAMMIENDEEQRRADERYRSESLRIQQDMVGIGSSLINAVTTDIRDLKTRFDSMENNINRMVSLLTAHTGQQPSAGARHQLIPTIDEEPRTPQRHRAVSIDTSASITPTRASPSRRRSSRAPSQSRTGRYGGFHN